MAQWTPEEQLAFDIAFGLKKVTIPGFRKALKEEDRFSDLKSSQIRQDKLAIPRSGKTSLRLKFLTPGSL